MRFSKAAVYSAIVLCLSFGVAGAASISMSLSGKGAVDSTTIKAGEPVMIDVYFVNDVKRAGLTLGFTIESDDIREIVHVEDAGNGLNKRGDIKGYDDWVDAEVWDLFGIFVIERDWDGELPELIGFGAVANEKAYHPHDLAKKLSFEIIVPEPGTLVIDSSFYPPGGKWMFSSPPEEAPSHLPEWGGPYEFKVIK
jgi:hypothetical protein